MSRKIIGVTVGTPISPARLDRELKPVKTVNGVAPDENGNVEVKEGITPTEREEIIQEAVQAATPVEKQYELIEEITIDEAVASVAREIDTKGEAYNFTAFRVRVQAPAAEETASNSQIIFSVRDAKSIPIVYHQATGGLSTSERLSQLVCRNDCGLVDYYVVSGAEGASSNMTAIMKYCNNPWNNVASVKLLTYPSTLLIPVGTKITIYGIRG